MKIDKWITFTRDLLPLVMSGDKTVTRRVIRPQPIPWRAGWLWEKGNKMLTCNTRKRFVELMLKNSPYGQPGAILGIKEGYKIVFYARRYIRGEYLVDGAELRTVLTQAEWDRWAKRKYPFRATPGRFMYKSLCRTRLVNRGVRVERLQDITEADAVLEGWPGGSAARRTALEVHSPTISGNCAREWFIALWNSINKKRGFDWSANPWTWRISFELAEA